METTRNQKIEEWRSLAVNLRHDARAARLPALAAKMIATARDLEQLITPAEKRSLWPVDRLSFPVSTLLWAA